MKTSTSKNVCVARFPFAHTGHENEDSSRVRVLVTHQSETENQHIPRRNTMYDRMTDCPMLYLNLNNVSIDAFENDLLRKNKPWFLRVQEHRRDSEVLVVAIFILVSFSNCPKTSEKTKIKQKLMK